MTSDAALLEAFRKQLRAVPANRELVLLAWQGQPGVNRDDLIDAYKQAEAAK